MTCPRCGRQNPEGAKFCLECGSALAPSESAREERKTVSVLFADLVGFTSRSERLDPEEVRAILKPYHAMLRAELERFGGTVEKFIGDAVMAVFGAPVAHEDDPERAARAALAIRDGIAAEGRLHVRVGITTGEALVTLGARPDAGEGMVAGDVVNTAARLQSVAPVDGILVDEPTQRRTSRAIEYRAHQPVTVKGKSDAVAVHEVVAARSRFGVDVRHDERVALVGRTREVGLLVGALERAMTEREPQLVTLVGVPGVGKSRVVWELFRHVEAGTELVAWRQGRSLPYAERVSFWALGEIVKAETGILETDAPDEATAKLRRTVETLELEPSDAEWVERHLRPLVGLEPAAELHGDRRGEAFAAWRRFLEALAEQRPLVLVFEDLQWSDDGMLDFIDHLAEWATGVPLLVVASSRPELFARRPDWGGGKPNATTVSLGPLTDAEAARLVASLVEHEVIPSRVREHVLERAQGIPLYAEEFARLVGEKGTVDELPETVQGIIAARLDVLSGEEKTLLQDAAVVGKVFWSGAVAAMRGRPRSDVESSLHGLERREFVRRERRSSVASETEYAFRHILVRDVAYGQIPRGERAERHVRAAGWIESLGRPADHAELLAQHYVAAMELARASGRSVETYARRARAALSEAGERAMALNAFASVARYLEVALEITPADAPDRPILLFRYGKALRVSAETGADVLAEAEAALHDRGEFGVAAEAAMLQAELAWFAGDGGSSATHRSRAAELVRDLPDSPSKAFVLSDLSRYQMLAGESAEAIVVGRRALEIAERLGLEEVRAHALINIGVARVNLGDRAGIDDLETAIDIAERANSPEVIRALNNLGASLESLGEAKRSASLIRDAWVRAREFGMANVERWMAAQLTLVDYAEGKWDEALRGADRSLADESSGHALDSLTSIVRSRIRFARGDPEGAMVDNERAVSAGRRSGDPQALIPTLAHSAFLLAESGRTDEANSMADELVGLARVQRAGELFDVALALLLLERGPDLQDIAARMAPTRWRDLFSLVADGDLLAAAEVADALGSLPVAATLRQMVAERLVAEGRAAEAREPLQRSLAFWRSVGATRYTEEAERVLIEAERLKTATPARAGGRRRR